MTCQTNKSSESWKRPKVYLYYHVFTVAFCCHNQTLWNHPRLSNTKPLQPNINGLVSGKIYRKKLWKLWFISLSHSISGSFNRTFSLKPIQWTADVSMKSQSSNPLRLMVWFIPMKSPWKSLKYTQSTKTMPFFFENAQMHNKWPRTPRTWLGHDLARTWPAVETSWTHYGSAVMNHYGSCMCTISYPVGGFWPPLWKIYEFVNWDD